MTTLGGKTVPKCCDRLNYALFRNHLAQVWRKYDNSIRFPTPITVGPGSVHQIADLLKEEGFESTTIVTDSVVATLPWFVRLVEKLRRLPMFIFSRFL